MAQKPFKPHVDLAVDLLVFRQPFSQGGALVQGVGEVLQFVGGIQHIYILEAGVQLAGQAVGGDDHWCWRWYDHDWRWYDGLRSVRPGPVILHIWRT